MGGDLGIIWGCWLTHVGEERFEQTEGDGGVVILGVRGEWSPAKARHRGHGFSIWDHPGTNLTRAERGPDKETEAREITGIVDGEGEGGGWWATHRVL